MASNVALGSTNYFKDGTFSTGTWLSGLPLSNLASDQCSPSTGSQTGNGVVTSAGGARLRNTFATAGSTVRVIGLFNTNLTSAATVVFQLFLTSGPTLVWTSGSVAGPERRYGQVIAVADQDYAADYLSIGINDGSNPDNHINIGGAFAGPVWRPLTGVTWDGSYDRIVDQQASRARGGQRFLSKLSDPRAWNIAFDAVRDSEVWVSLDALRADAAFGGNVLFVPDITSASLYREAVFGPLESQSPVGFSGHSPDARSWRAQIVERL